MVQLIPGFLTLLMATAIAWYEGSEIIDNSLEWKYSTPFSRLFNIEIVNGQDISQLDYFVYAAKFQPFFPMIMTVSVIYIFTVLIFFHLSTKSSVSHYFVRSYKLCIYCY